MWKLRPRELKFLSKVTEVNGGGAGTKLSGPPVLRRPSLHEAPGQPSSSSPGQGSQGQTLISSRAEFQMEASPASSGKTIDGVLMTSGFTDKLRAGPGCCGLIVSRDGNQTPRPLGSRRRRRGARRGAWGFSPWNSHRIRTTCQVTAGFLVPRGSQGGPRGVGGALNPLRVGSSRKGSQLRVQSRPLKMTSLRLSLSGPLSVHQQQKKVRLDWGSTHFFCKGPNTSALGTTQPLLPLPDSSSVA